MARKSRKTTGAVIEAPAQESNCFSTAIYVRLSIENSGKDDDGDSIANQISFCKAYLAGMQFRKSVGMRRLKKWGLNS